ncbi:MAG: VanZ family protein [Pirellula sp.]
MSSTQAIRSAYRVLFATALVLLIYASIVPLGFEPMGFEQAWERFQLIPWLKLDIYRRSDWISNGLVVLPVSFLLCGAIVYPVTSSLYRVLGVTCAVGFMILVVCGIEFLQIWFPRRTLSRNDLLAGWIGSLLGGLAWLTCGRYVTTMADIACFSSLKSQRLSKLAMMLSLISLFHMLLPFDFVTSLGELFRKYKSNDSWNSVALKILGLPIDWTDTLRNSIRYIPIGVWIAFVFSKRIGWFAVLVIPLFLELIQLFIFSRNASVADAIAGGIGIQLGRCIDFDALAIKLRSMRKLTVLGLLVLYFSALVIATCVNGQVHSLSFEQLSRRIHLFFPVPLSRYYLKSDFSAFNLLFSKTLVFVPLGFLSALFFITHKKIRSCSFHVFLLCMSLGLLVESSQLFLPPLIPDFWDVFVYAFGGLVGYHLLQTVLMEPDRPRNLA